MSDKILNARISQKHDTAVNWDKATNFVPMAGEVIIYDPDTTNTLPRIKIGDGATTVGNLPFTIEPLLEIGGRNLLQNSGSLEGDNWSMAGGGSGSTKEISEYQDEINQFTITAPSGADSLQNVLEGTYGSTTKQTIRTGDKLVMSVWYYVSSTGPAADEVAYFRLHTMSSAGAQVGGITTSLQPANMVKDKWTKVVVRYTVVNDSEFYVRCGFGLKRQGNISFTMPKLERGTVATDWSIAPEDVGWISVADVLEICGDSDIIEASEVRF